MKIKTDFVTNSSSTGYILTVYKKKLTAREFVESLYKLGLESEMKQYDFDKQYTKQDIINSLINDYDIFPIHGGERGKVGVILSFGDESGTPAGIVFDYCLRSGFESPGQFKIKFHEYYR